MSEMTWEQKLAACQAFADASFVMRKPGDWYVNWRAEIKDGAVLVGSYGNGARPEEAMHDHWRVVTGIGPGQYWVANAYETFGKRRAARWNGFMWEAIDESLPSAA